MKHYYVQPLELVIAASSVIYKCFGTMRGLFQQRRALLFVSPLSLSFFEQQNSSEDVGDSGDVELPARGSSGERISDEFH